MPLYMFTCDNCSIFWEKDRPMSDSGKRSMCPECKKKGNRQYGWAHTSFKGADFSTNKHREEEFARSGMDKAQADTFYKESLESSSERISTGNQHYARYTPNYEKLAKEGKLKSHTPEKEQERKETMKKMTEHAYKKAGLDVTKSNNPIQNL